MIREKGIADNSTGAARRRFEPTKVIEIPKESQLRRLEILERRPRAIRSDVTHVTLRADAIACRL